MHDDSAVAPFQLDAFDVVGLLGKGAMGEVLDAVHRPSGRPVAIKVLPADLLADSTRVSAFRDEIRAVAGLNHPSIVQVFDVGDVSPAAEEASLQRIKTGSPYLVMERVDGADLARRRPGRSWPRIEEILSQLLAGLAHAHARGVIHRDIKPSNVLVERSTGLVKITDFGLAHIAIEPQGHETAEATWGGTPAFMAPEQFEHHWRDFGPGTDLYSVGCLAFALLAGQPPFGTGSPMVLAFRHLREAIPEMDESLPARVRQWIRILLSKSQEGRFRCAADAAQALAGVGELNPALWGLGAIGDHSEGPTAPIATALRSAVDQSLTGEWKLLSVDELEVPEVDTMPPAGWRPPAWSPGPTRLPGAGMGLLGLRAPPLVGRQAIRDRLWKELVATTQQRAPRLVLLRGDLGVGKSRLARWVAERAHELGVGESLHAVHSPRPSSGDGIGPMLRRHLRCGGLDPRELNDRLDRLFPGSKTPRRLLRRTLHALVAAASGARDDSVSPAERDRAVLAVLDALGRNRPVVLRLDDVQWGPDILEWVESALDGGAGAMPLLIIATAHTEATPKRPAAAALLERVSDRPEVVSLQVPALDADERGVLLRNTLGLNASLAARVEARCGGNTLFMLQLVQSWVVGQRLEARADGYGLVEGGDVVETGSLDTVAKGRLAAALTEAGAQHGGALNIAAAMGLDVDVGRWRQVVAAAGGVDPGRLERTLLEHGLVRRGPGVSDRRFVFAHGALRDCIEREARQSEAWAVANRACADTLHAGPLALSPVERATHYVEAGDDGQALPLLVQALQGPMSRETMGQWPRRLDLLHAIATRLDLPEDNEAWGWHAFALARMAQMRNRADASFEGFELLELRARRQGWDEIFVASLCSRALAATHRGLPEVAAECARQAAILLPSFPGSLQFGRCCRLLGLVHKQAGRLELAERWFRLGTEQANRDSLSSRSGCHRGLSDLAVQRGDLEGAQAELNSALALMDARSEAPLLNSLGEVARQRGDLRAACGHYEEAIDVSRFHGTTIPAALFNLGVTKLTLEDFRSARSTFIEGTRMSSERGASPWQAVAALGLVVADAGLGAWAGWGTRCASAVSAVHEVGWVEADLAAMAVQGADLATAAEATAGARLLRALARQQLQRLGRQAEADALPNG